MPTYKIVVANSTSDAQGIRDIGEAAIKHHPFLKMTPIPEKVNAMVDTLMNGDLRQNILIIMTADDIPVGILVGSNIQGSPTIHGVKPAAEVVWYVDPDHRGTPYSTMMIDEYEAWAKMIGASHICISHYMDDTGQKLAEYYKSIGYSPIELTYLKELT